MNRSKRCCFDKKMELLILDPFIWWSNKSYSRKRKLTCFNESVDSNICHSLKFIQKHSILLLRFGILKINPRSIRQKEQKEVNASEARPSSYPTPLIPFRILHRPRETSLTLTTALIASLDTRQLIGQVGQVKAAVQDTRYLVGFSG